jgi:hypothetical protein
METSEKAEDMKLDLRFALDEDAEELTEFVRHLKHLKLLVQYVISQVNQQSKIEEVRSAEDRLGFRKVGDRISIAEVIKCEP